MFSRDIGNMLIIGAANNCMHDTQSAVALDELAFGIQDTIFLVPCEMCV